MSIWAYWFSEFEIIIWDWNHSCIMLHNRLIYPIYASEYIPKLWTMVDYQVHSLRIESYQYYWFYLLTIYAFAPPLTSNFCPISLPLNLIPNTLSILTKTCWVGIAYSIIIIMDSYLWLKLLCLVYIRNNGNNGQTDDELIVISWFYDYLIRNH